jgi:PhoPQ-activated pathogenicity-related protein
MRSLLPAALALLALAAPVRADGAPARPVRAGRATPLDEYMARAQPAYGWSIKGEAPGAYGATVLRLELTSQTWKGLVWRHRLNVIVPAPAAGERARPGHALLAITGTGGEDEHLALLSELAARLGVPVAILHDVPNQPLYADPDHPRGLKEDALIARTFVEFARTGEADWPLLLPMTRSAVAAMDCLGELSAQRANDAAWGHGRLERFVTCGASKRGWTTWLSACVEPSRVIGIAPIVYDNLNIRAQIARHLEVWGKPSPSIHDYTDAGLMELLAGPRGDTLLSIVDPYTYADRLTVPKMAMMGTNDTYWPLDAIHLYRHRLPGELFCHYVPNAGHSAGLSIADGLAGFFDHVTKRSRPLPVVTIEVTPRATALVTVADPQDRPRVRGVRVWTTRVEGKDFTKARWEKVEAPAAGEGWSAALPAGLRDAGTGAAGPGGSAAFIGEVELRDSSDRSFLLHTPVSVWELPEH